LVIGHWSLVIGRSALAFRFWPTTKGQGPTTLLNFMSCHSRIRSSHRRFEQGYILLMLMLFITLLAIAAAAVAPSIAFRVKRDREEELIHRGTQYSRAIRRYVKKTGRYPSRLEDLENTNNIRFLRKRYKDPVTGKDLVAQLAGQPGELPWQRQAP
jgi:type II secretory pathway pseudopilin PulG